MDRAILITGASGFIGQHLVSFLSNKKNRLVLATDKAHVSTPSADIIHRKFNLQQDEDDYGNLFDNVEFVIHLAGIAHNESVSKTEYKAINTDGTMKLARRAQASGVKRFIFLSTVKVYGESTSDKAKQAFSEKSVFNPGDDYSKSKLEAEYALKQICAEGTMDYVIVRVPLVYGPGVKANFFKLMKFVSRKIPLPFLRATNLRSFLYVENLCDLLDKIIYSPNCKNREHLVKDHDLSTAELVSKMSYAFGTKPRLFHLSPRLIRPCARLLNLSSRVDSLFGSLLIDDARTRKDLSWEPVIDSDTGIGRTVEWFKNLSV